MSLQGTFDTLSVTELFGLLSTAGKTGALRLEAGEHEASLLVRAGRCCAVDEAAVSAPVGSESELAARLVDVGFTLARQPAGSFRFSDTDVAASDLAVAFEPAVAEIAEMLEAWKDIESTIPSLDARLAIAPVLHAEQIVLRADEWALIAGLRGTPSVRDLVAGGSEPLLAVCRRVKDLVDRGAIEIGVAPLTSDGRAAASERPIEPSPVEPRPVEPRPVEPSLIEPSSVERRVADPAPRGRAALEAASANLLETTEPFAPETVAPETVAPETVAPETVAPEPVEPETVVVREPARVREPVAVAADRSGGAGSAPSEASDDPSADRGALLRLFSALKD